MIKIGLTGAIASGKSEAEKILKRILPVVDLDIVSHKILEEDAREEILKEFNTLNRKEIGKVVFQDIEKRKKLEEIIHPRLKTYVLNFFEEKKDKKAVVVSGALLYEAGFFPLFDKTIFIDAPKNIRLERLQKRNSLNREDALIRINSQKNEGKTKADFIIQNTGTIEELKEKIKQIVSIIEIQDSIKFDDYYKYMR